MKLPQFRIGSCLEKIISSARSAFFEVMGKKSTNKTWKHKQVYEDDEASAAKRQKLDDDQVLIYEYQTLLVCLFYKLVN